jgi:CheY-like chemotaxis protein
MDNASLEGRRILVVEDEYLLAEDLSNFLEDAGAEVLGPVPSVEDALSLIETGGHIDAAILDVNLRGKMVFPVAKRLREHGIGFAFVTGYDSWALPEPYTSVPRMEKPLQTRGVTAVLMPLLS